MAQIINKSAIAGGRNLRSRWTILLWVAPAAVFCLGLAWGRYQVDLLDVLLILGDALGLPVSGEWSSIVQTVVLNVRLPRVLAAMIIGGGLSVSGAAFQGLFRNPLVSPYVLGVASGAGFGAALGIIIWNQPVMIQGCAFFFGMTAVIAAWLMSRLYKASGSMIIVLAGVIVGAFFQSLLSLIKYLADPDDKLPVIIYWLMGSLSSITMEDLYTVLLPMGVCIVGLLMVRWRLNVLSFGDEEAKTLGVEAGRLRFGVVVAVTIITASAVSVSGIVGWVGLVVPHLARMMVGPDYRKLIPASLALGACYLVLIDGIARNISSAEIPLGILTATVGAPFFAWLLGRGRTGWA
ncbi:iron complex transport system permease protein [Maridesulfovibrio ferrireducens]|uniref:Iron complex transport system permease protein n=1 Tax=Maridesulfovibrio ferrireducens TaxID=246191 RepID=A0A1G9CAF5_9BACT|nr:iron ABC transporter permease [Maridesulfovibrio ferrireducens]SDK48650.1 iron complex transport system permease protein [Maridesulfovibrio ferrireducens]